MFPSCLSSWSGVCTWSFILTSCQLARPAAWSLCSSRAHTGKLLKYTVALKVESRITVEQQECTAAVHGRSRAESIELFNFLLFHRARLCDAAVSMFSSVLDVASYPTTLVYASTTSKQLRSLSAQGVLFWSLVKLHLCDAWCGIRDFIQTCSSTSRGHFFLHYSCSFESSCIISFIKMCVLSTQCM